MTINQDPSILFINYYIMRTLTEYIKEHIQECGCCGDCAATPANTVGMGNVEPLSTDPVPTNTNILKKKKNQRRRKWLVGQHI